MFQIQIRNKWFTIVSLNESGNYTIRLDVIDWVGRMSSANSTLLIENVVPLSN